MHLQNLIKFSQDLYLKLEFFVTEEILITLHITVGQNNFGNKIASWIF